MTTDPYDTDDVIVGAQLALDDLAHGWELRDSFDKRLITNLLSRLIAEVRALRNALATPDESPDVFDPEYRERGDVRSCVVCGNAYAPWNSSEGWLCEMCYTKLKPPRLRSAREAVAHVQAVLAACSDAPRVRLTRAQREALEFVSQDGAEIWKRGDQTDCVFHTFVKGIERATLQALLKDECVEMIGYDTDGTWTRYAITPQGRAALRDAATPRVRLTRAQRDALELLAQDGYYMSRPSMFDKSDVHAITNGRGGDHLKVRSATVTALYKAKLIASKETFDEYRITQRGRAALRDAEEA